MQGDANRQRVIRYRVETEKVEKEDLSSRVNASSKSRRTGAECKDNVDRDSSQPYVRSPDSRCREEEEEKKVSY